jgi:hypothetical protein
VKVLGPGVVDRTLRRFRNIGEEECDVASANSPPNF